MADMDAIREARRRRILQASENRMNRVLGTVKHGESQDSDVTQSTETAAATATNISPDVQTVKPDDSQTTNDTSTTLRQRFPVANRQSERTEPPRSTVKISPLKRPVVQSLSQTSQASADSSQNDLVNSSRSSADAKMILKHFEFLRIIMCVMVAYLCRRVLATGYGIFYFQTVVLPFACMEAAFFVFKSKVLHNVTLPHKSSMLIGLLMLCGIKPAILQAYNKAMGYVTAASEDFAMFFFAFMMANVFIV